MYGSVAAVVLSLGGRTAEGASVTLELDLLKPAATHRASAQNNVT